MAQREAEEIVVEENRGSNEAVAAAILGVLGTVRVPTARCEMVFVDGKRGLRRVAKRRYFPGTAEPTKKNWRL